MPLPTIAEVAAKAIETPKDCTETDVMRLGLWFHDHSEHVRRHAELSAPMGRVLSPSQRLAAVRDASPVLEARGFAGDAQDDQGSLGEQPEIET